MISIIPSKEHVKILGRTYFIDNQRYFAHSASGIEFIFTGTRVEITVTGDNIAVNQDNQKDFARFAVYVEKERVIDELMDNKEKTYLCFESRQIQTVTIRIIKLSEAAMSTIGIKEIRIDDSAIIRPSEDRKHRIEFIGDSITCGFGIDDEVAEHEFSTATEDATQAYAYLTANALQADYSLVSFSGYGIISGYSGDGETKIDNQLVPDYYEAVGFSRGLFGGIYEVESIAWDFQQFQPELIVVNLGTNDDSYCLDYIDRQLEFKLQYIQFLKMIRRNNPNAKILCTLGIMGDRLCKTVNDAVTEYTGQTNDVSISTMNFVPQLESDGFAACWHPSKATQIKASKQLIETICEQKLLS